MDERDYQQMDKDMGVDPREFEEREQVNVGVGDVDDATLQDSDYVTGTEPTHAPGQDLEEEADVEVTREETTTKSQQRRKDASKNPNEI